jgi:putative membrane protein
VTRDAPELAEDTPLEEVGEDPDPRFTFANERTFLAWNRTALALVAAGLAVAQLLRFGSGAARLIVALPLIVLGAVVSLTSYQRWERNERAMRLGEPLHYSRLPRLLALGVGIVAIVGGIVAVVDVLTR